jgi:hypothetical protein
MELLVLQTDEQEAAIAADTQAGDGIALGEPVLAPGSWPPQTDALLGAHSGEEGAVFAGPKVIHTRNSPAGALS